MPEEPEIKRATQPFRRRERDSNPRGFRLTVFKTVAIDHSAIPPDRSYPVGVSEITSAIAQTIYAIRAYHTALFRVNGLVPFKQPKTEGGLLFAVARIEAVVVLIGSVLLLHVSACPEHEFVETL
jgi:hypothetical protein